MAIRIGIENKISHMNRLRSSMIFSGLEMVKVSADSAKAVLGVLDNTFSAFVV